MTDVARKVTGRPEQAGLAEGEMLTDGATRGLTEMLTVLETAIAGTAQVELLVRIQLTWSPSARLLLVKVLPPAAAIGLPFIRHSYCGAEPPPTALAVKVTGAPAQMGLTDSEMVNDGGEAGRTDMGIALDCAVAGLAQASLLVIVQVTTELSVILLVVILAPLPASIPFTCHWKEGLEPPLPGLAVKVTGLPGQMEVAEAEMLSAGMTYAFTFTG